MSKIRPAVPEDAQTIAAINTVCWQTAYRGLFPDDALDALSVTDKRVEHFANDILVCEIYLVAENKTGVAGYLSGGKARAATLPYAYEIYTLYIHPNFQGQGIGTALMKAFQEKIKNAPFYVYTLDGNTKAIRFYQKRGGLLHPQFNKEGIAYGYTFNEVFLGFEKGIQ